MSQTVIIDGNNSPVVPEPAPTYRNMRYGPFDRNVLDFWRAEGDRPAPLIFYIHGGGWVDGNKDRIYPNMNIAGWLAKGVSVASIDYRYTSEAILPAPVYDAARALQFLRYKAQELNIDPSRVALQGNSAGGSSALWLLFHADLADRSSLDPVLRESTRVRAAFVHAAQTSIDPVVIKEWIGELAASFYTLAQAVGAQNYDDLIEHYDRYKPLLDEFSPITHMSPDAPPVFLAYPEDMRCPPLTPEAAIHHGLFGVKLKEIADEIGYTDCLLSIPGFVDAKITPVQFLETVLFKGERK